VHLVLDKEGAAGRKGIFMIDASKGFKKDGPKNRLRAQDIHKIVDAFTRQLELPRYSRMVPLSEISDPKNDFNLNLPRYIDASEPEDIQDIDGHLRGGIPNRDLDALEAYWKVFPGVRAALFKKADRPGYSPSSGSPPGTSRAPSSARRVHRLEHADQEALRQVASRGGATAPRDQEGRQAQGPHRRARRGAAATFQKAKLIDAYDVYQHLMDYWAETMQDDVYLIASEGWREAAKPAADGRQGQEVQGQARLRRSASRSSRPS
jgi:type I restriction enzyme M protein